MTNEPSPDLRARFADLLDDEDDAATLRLLGRLDRQYRCVDPAIWLSGPPRKRRPTWRLITAGRHTSRGRRLPLTVLSILAAVLFISLGVALATGNILNLGKPTNTLSTNAYFPVGAFHRVSKTYAAHLGDTALFFYLPRYEFSNEEEWPLVKALEQFGTLTGVRAEAPYCSEAPHNPGTTGLQLCTAPGFDLSRASLKSRFIHLALRPLTDSSGRCLIGKLSSADWQRLTKFTQASPRSRVHLCTALIDAVRYFGSIVGMPALEVGSYAQAGVELVKPLDFQSPAPTPASTDTPGQPNPQPPELSFAAVQHALVSAQDPPGTTLNEDVNAETNVITALICHTDDGKPASVCGRLVIRSILKHVK